MRGKLHEVKVAVPHHGITPADAGKTERVRIRRVAIQDHPRGCGENRKGKSNSAMRRGSPPRMRGKHLIAGILLDRIRITPADAGKTLHGLVPGVAVGDHPRGCGENPLSALSNRLQRGSPPRMRGKRVERYNGKFTDRITPADAGKTLSHSQNLG